MGVNLRGVELFMPEYLLQGQHIDAALLIHERRRRVAQLMNGILLVVQPCRGEIFICHPLHGFHAYALMATA